jgi:hypothetical protein
MKSGTSFRGLSWFERRFDTKDTTDTKVRRVFPLGKVLVLVGLGIAGLGLLIMLGVPFGRLPGDFYVRRGTFTFYFPLATSIVLSILITLALAFFRR